MTMTYLVGFDVTSLFTNVPLMKPCWLWRIKCKRMRNWQIEHLSHQKLFVTWQSSVSGVCTSIKMEITWNKMMELLLVLCSLQSSLTCTWNISLATNKPKFWVHYVDDTFVILPHGRDKLASFLQHIKATWRKFSMEIEEEGRNFLFVVLVERLGSGRMTSVHRRKTHMDR